MDFDWDAKKDQQNREKHGLSFNEARELFVSGNDYIEIFDVHHSEEEERFIAIGPIVRGLIVVVWTERPEGVIRIISARPASKREIVLFRATMENTR